MQTASITSVDGQACSVHSDLAQAPAPRVDPIIRVVFYGFVFSLLFEQGAGHGLPMQIPTLAGWVLIMAAALQPGICFRKPAGAIGWLFCYLLIFGISVAIHGDALEHGEETWRLAFWLVQLFLLCWISSNLLTDERVAHNALAALSAACGLIAILYLLGVVNTTIDVGKTNRGSALGQNPSNLAGLMSIGFISILALTYDRGRKQLSYRIGAAAVLCAMGVVIVASESRGGLVALGAGLLALGLAWRRTGSVPKNVLGMVVVLAILGGVVFFSGANKRRFEASLETGDGAGRERIYPAAWQMFREEPIIGWGPAIKDFELQRRVQQGGFQSRDPHNLFLDLLTGTGLVGTTAFVGAIWLCCRSAWRARLGPQGGLPLAMLVLTLTFNLTMNWMYSKAFWFSLAYALASARQVVLGRQAPAAAEC
jgi:O-antigen ligase